MAGRGASLVAIEKTDIVATVKQYMRSFNKSDKKCNYCGLRRASQHC